MTQMFDDETSERLDGLTDQLIPMLRAGDPRVWTLLKFDPELSMKLYSHLKAQGREDLEAEFEHFHGRQRRGPDA